MATVEWSRFRDVLSKAQPIGFGGSGLALAYAQNFLERFGYAAGDTQWEQSLGEQTSEALRKFQSFYDLGESGILDLPSLQAMQVPRCAMQDRPAPTADRRSALIMNDVAVADPRCCWNRRVLRYALSEPPAGSTRDRVLLEIASAFSTWQAALDAIGVRRSFVQVDASANPDWLFEWKNSADVHGNVDYLTGPPIAHADYPGECSIFGGHVLRPVHFDSKEEPWSADTVPDTFDIQTIALHEIGHALGLVHANIGADAVMNPNFAFAPQRALKPKDKSDLASLYLENCRESA